ncbi:MAG: D-aminoacyl-tRNA deacylase [Eubacteriales bacterium]
MRAVIQRVNWASVKVDNKIIGSINEGLLVFVGISDNDKLQVIDYIVDKITNLRIFEDKEGKMNLSLKDIDGGLLIIPNFTLYGDCRKGRRPSFSNSAKVKDAKIIYDNFMEKVKGIYPKVEQGEFQADMKVDLLNDGPVTFLLDSEKYF